MCVTSSPRHRGCGPYNDNENGRPSPSSEIEEAQNFRLSRRNHSSTSIAAAAI